MNKPSRLFDFFEEQLNLGSIEGMLVAKENGQWRKYSTKEVKDIVDKLSAALLSLGISGGDGSPEGRNKVAIVSRNRPEWVFLDLAVQQIGAVLVPIYPTSHVNDLEFILNDALVKLVFVNDPELLAKVNAVRARTPSVEDVFTFEKIEGAKHWSSLLPLGRQEHFEKLATEMERITTEDLFTIIYTSGTTGTPKGVMLSHRNVLSNVMGSKHYFPIYRNTRSLSFLPLNHIFERMVTYVYLFSGCSIHYVENMDTLGDTIREVKPEMFTTVPRLLEKVYERIMSKADELTGVKKTLFFWALRLGEQYDINSKGSLNYRIQLSLANKIVFNKWREGLGNSIKCIVTGAAACQVKLIRIFSAAGIPVMEGYGQTESSPVISVNRLTEGGRMFGTVGPVIDNVEVRIAADGEILCKGPNVMMGYYKRPDLTAEAVKDGWLYTGDIGELLNNKFLKITDRKKEIFKTSGGKYVAPQPIENKMVESPFIEQIMIVGEGEKFVAALIVPASQVLKDWCKHEGLDEQMPVHQLLRQPKVVNKFNDIVAAYNKNFNHVEQVKKFVLLPNLWTIEGGELTPTLKLKRRVILEKYKLEIKSLYEASAPVS